MTRGRPIPYKEKRYTVTANGNSFQLSFPPMSELQAGELVSYELLDNGCIVIIPDRVKK
jgi:hypothetical protein